MTTANEKRPKVFKDYKGQLGAVGYTTSIIKNGNHPNGLLISGVPGTGKTSLAHLYVHGTLCEKRKEGDYEPCGECSSCKSDIEKGGHPNVTYYRITEASAFKEIVSDLISMTKAMPQLTHDNIRADNFRRFIIIDELQNCTRQSISPFLDSLEFAAPEITVVLISMDLDKLDYIVKDAIESRCIELSLDKLNIETISSTLYTEKPNLHPDAANIIAYLSKGNMRKAWSIFDYLQAQLPVEEITAELIAAQKIGGLSKEKCLEILNSLENNTWSETNKLLTKISNNPVQALDFFVNIIVSENLNNNGIELLSDCSLWLISDYKIPINVLFRKFQGKRITGVIEKEIIPIVNKSTVETVYSNKEKVKEIKNDVVTQLSNITGGKLKIEYNKHPVFTFTKWIQFLEYYADNN